MKKHWGRRELDAFEITKRKSHLKKRGLGEERRSEGLAGARP